MKQRVPIVAVGASAGGLEAVSQLLSHIDANFAYAVVILQHLSPNYKSMMAELLTRETRLNVETLADGTIPQPGVVYVVPPNCNAVVRDERLHLEEAAPEVSPKPSINEFFFSLADSLQENAVGVVLSGTGSDGTAGLRAIQAAGGITIAQKPETAKYEGMPVAAIDAEVADFTLAPEEIAQKLMQLPEAENLDDSFSHSVLDRIISVLNQVPDQDFSGYKVGTLSRRVRRRMVATGHHTMDSYCEWINNSPEEVDQLAKDILISVTAFFRDPESFAVLRRSIAESIQALSDDEEYRVWVAGCATGEEAYTVAILIMEELLANKRANAVQIFATDIDEDALNFARQGVYRAQALANLKEQLITRYFHLRKDKSYEVSKKLRDMIVFARHNVINDPPFFRLNLITCRNLLIYFDNPLQSKVLQRFHFSLKEHGTLFLGRSESVAQAEQLFTYTDRRERVFQKSGESRPMLDSRINNQLGSVTIRRKESPQLLVDALTHHLSSTAALCSVEGKILQTSGAVQQFFKFPEGATDTLLFDVVATEFKSDLMSMFHQLKKLNQPQSGRPLELDGRYWQLSLSYTSVGNETRILLVIAPSQQEITDKPSKSLSQLYTDELQVTQEQMQSLVEELATANEEMQSLNEEAQASNEELQATNEELEAANEELQATNEELVSVNEELSVKTSELGALNDEYIHLYDSLDFPVLVFDETLNLLRFNSSAAFQFNLRRNARGTSVNRIRFPLYLDDVEQLLGRALAHGEKHESLVQNDDRYYQLVITPGVDEEEQIRFVVLNLIDVTDIHHTRNELDESENRLQTIMDNTTILIAMKDLQGRYVYVNDAFTRAYGIEGADYELKSDFDLFPDEFAGQLWASDLRAIRTLEMVESELNLMIDGGVRYFATRHQVLRDH
ncbi:MAG: PAS domain-containing protein, partial [Amphritea sp.]|nr:PAS domain-containing protein [Amphritea sp.]